LNVETMVFKEAWIRGGELNGVIYPGCHDKTRSYGEIELGDKVAIGYDPQSGSTTRFAKDAAVVMMANSPNDEGKWNPRLVAWWKGQTPISDSKRKDSQLQIIVDMARIANGAGCKPVVILEGNQIQRGLKEPLQDLAHSQGVLLTVDVSNTGVDKWDEETGIESCTIDFQNGLISLPYATPADEEKTIGFENCMMEYGTSKYFDVPIAYWKARRHLYDIRFKSRVRPAVMVNQMPRYMQARYKRMGMSEVVTIVDAHSMPVREESRLD
jgi:hypothetical protein